MTPQVGEGLGQVWGVGGLEAQFLAGLGVV
jgi:hypothetical protein